MGRIPEFKEGGVARTSQLVDVNQPLRDAQQIQGIVSSVASAAQSIKQRGERLDLEADQSYLVKNEAKFKEASIERRKKFQQSFKDDPNNPMLIKLYEDESKKALNTFSQGFKRKDSKQAFERMARNQIVQNKSSLVDFQAQQTQDNILTNNSETVDIIKKSSIENGKVANALDSLNQIEALKVTNTSSLGGKNAQRLYESHQKEVAVSFVDSNLAGENISEVKKLLKEEKFRAALGASGISQTRNKIRAIERQREALAAKRAKKFKGDKWAEYDFKGGTSFPLSATAFNPAADPEGKELQKTLQQRALTIENAKDKYNIELPYFRKEEAKALVKVFNTGRPQQIGALMRHIDNNTTPEMQKSLARQLFFDEKQPALAAAMSIASEAPDEATLIVQGKNFLDPAKNEGVTGKNLISTPSDSKVVTAFDDYMKASVPDGQARSIGREAAFYHYTAKQFQAGVVSNELDEVKFQESVDAVMGKPITYNDSYIPSFRITTDEETRFADEDDFEVIVDRLDEKNLVQSQGSFPVVRDGRAVNLKKSRGRLNFTAASDGKYFLKRDNQMLLDSESGQPYMLDMKAYHQFLMDPKETRALTELQMKRLYQEKDPGIEDKIQQMKMGAGLR